MPAGNAFLVRANPEAATEILFAAITRRLWGLHATRSRARFETPRDQPLVEIAFPQREAMNCTSRFGAKLTTALVVRTGRLPQAIAQTAHDAVAKSLIDRRCMFINDFTIYLQQFPQLTHLNRRQRLYFFDRSHVGTSTFFILALSHPWQTLTRLNMAKRMPDAKWNVKQSRVLAYMQQ
jgi:hypothetical protein